MAIVHLPRSLVALFPDAPRRLEVDAADLRALVRQLDGSYPGMWDRLCAPGPRFREHINVFVDGERAELEASLRPASVVHVIPAVSGGSAEAEGAEERAPDGKPMIHPETRAAWRAWLEANHARPTGVWLASWRTATGRARMTYDEMVEEALCFGWVDGRANTLDAQRSLQWLSPRRPRSGWSRSNKERVERLEREGRMTDAGRWVIEAARANGSWNVLDGATDLVVPDDLATAFDMHPGAREQWESLPRSARRVILEWIALARRPETRAVRVAETAERSQRGERAGPAGGRPGRPSPQEG